MPKYAAFLRAVNLGRNRRVSGAQLKALFEEMGFEDVATFRTSGNVVFEVDRATKLRERIEAALARELGWDVGVFLRTDEEVRSIAAHEPFDRELVEATEGRLQVALLPKKPAKDVHAEVLPLATVDDWLAFGDRELYWLPRAGTQGSALDLKAIEKLLGPWTMRTKGTVELMAAKFFA